MYLMLVPAYIFHLAVDPTLAQAIHLLLFLHLNALFRQIRFFDVDGAFGREQSYNKRRERPPAQGKSTR